MRLPPLHAVQFFEAAGRLGSFKAAADELGVTPGAVTKQIQMLESHLGVPLFSRGHRSVTLTATGATYLEAVADGFDRLARGTAAVLREDIRQPLNIWCTALFMQQWLVQRLASFRALNPHQEVIITAGDARDPVPPVTDVAIRIGGSDGPGFVAHPLIDIRLVPVCSPQYLARSGRLEQPQDLAAHTLLQSQVRPAAWGIWLSAAGVKDLPVGYSITFPNASTAYRAAMEGVGIALGHRGFIEHDLAAGRLLTPFDLDAATGDGYRLVHARSRRPPRRVVCFRKWILDMIEGGS